MESQGAHPEIKFSEQRINIGKEFSLDMRKCQAL
jgi:hypothetical protein